MAVDFFARDFGDDAVAPPSSAPKKDFFSRDFEDVLPAESGDLPTDKIVIVPGGTINPTRNRREFSAGLKQSIGDLATTLDPVAMWLEGKLGKITAGGAFPTAEQAHAMNIVNRQAYEKQYGENPNAQAGRFIGQMLTTAPIMAGAGGIASGVGGLLAESAPRLVPIVDFLAGNSGGNILSRVASKGVQGAILGGETAALNSGASDRPIREQIGTGMALGGLIGTAAPALYEGGRAAFGKLRDYIAPFTESGRENIANSVIQHFTGDNPLTINAAELVPGSVPTLAEATANPGIAHLQDTLRDINSKPFVERSAQNAAARNNALLQAAGTPQDIESAIAARNADATKALDKVFQNTVNSDVSPIHETINNILSSPYGKRPAVSKSLNDVRSMLADAEGMPIKDPATLYHSVRKGIDDLLDKKDLTNQAGKQASAQLLQIKDSLDNAIEQGAPGFKNYLQQYSNASKPIDAMQWLQGLNLTDSRGNITLPKVQNALKNINKLQSSPGVNKAKALSDMQIDTLKALRDDLLRQDNLTLGKSYGSPTVQKAGAQNKLQSLLKGREGLFSGKVNPETLGAGAGTALGSALGAPGAGAVIGATAGKALSGAQGRRNQLIRHRLEEMVLNPQSYSPVVNNNALMAGMFQNSAAVNAIGDTGRLGLNRLLELGVIPIPTINTSAQ